MPAPASLLITNARVITTNPLQPRAEALAVAGNEIIFVGNNQEAKAYQSPGTRTIGAQGCTLLPGFIDSHYHLWVGSAELEAADLNPVNTFHQLTQALRQHAQQNPHRNWINGAHLTYSLFPNGALLNRHHLDDILPNHPIALMAYDYHTMWANTPGLELAGLLQGDAARKIEGVVIGEDGLASGELREPAAYGHLLRLTGAWGRAASGLINLGLPQRNPAELAEDRALLRKGLEIAAQYGITSLHNMDGGYDQLSFYAALEQAGELTCRVYVPLNISGSSSPQRLEEALAMQHDFQGEMARGGFLKTFMDGVLESQTAFLLEDYAGQPGSRGSALYAQQEFNELAIQAEKISLQLCVHAIGDAAVRRTLNGFEVARTQNGARDRRHRIEHIELIHPSDIPRFSQLDVIASMQPLHLPVTEDHLWRLRAGKERWKNAFAWQSLRQAGSKLIFGSDWPIVAPGPLPALQTALTRSPWQPGDPSQKQSLHDFIASFTHLAAYAEFAEGRKGQLVPGRLADLVLLNTDLESLPPSEYGNVHACMTVCDGHIVFEA